VALAVIKELHLTEDPDFMSPNGAFTLSQAGMAKHHLTHREPHGCMGSR